MIKIQNVLKRVSLFLQNNPFVFPISLLGIALVTYGVFIFSLGFYWDDWPPLLLTHIADKSMLWKYYASDRPFQSWTYYVLFPLCRDSAFLWQLSAIVFRWTSALAFYYTFFKIFPKQKNLLQWAAILFVVFPGFADQYVSVVYSSVFLTYTVFGASLLTMVLAIQKKNRFWVYFPISILLTGIHLFTMEYFAGLEVLRLVLILILQSRFEKKWLLALLKTLKIWLPYLVLFAFFAYWRLVIYSSALGGSNFDRNYPYLFSEFFKAPGDTLFILFRTIESDLRFLFLNSWSERILPAELPIKTMTFWFSLVLGLMASGAFAFLNNRNEEDQLLKLKGKEVWLNVCVAFSIIFFGLLPIWSTLKQITKGKWSDRFDLAVIFGVTLLISTLFFMAIQNPKIRNGFFILLVGLSISYHIRTGNDYRKDFLRQKAFYVQLKWRIPSLEPRTVLFSPSLPTSKEAEYSYAMGVNLLYSQDEITPEFDYWYLGPRYFKPEVLINDPTLPIDVALRTYKFSGSASKLVSIHMPSTGCLWVVDPYYALMPAEIENFPLYGRLTNQTLIVDQPTKENGLAGMFDFSAQNTWCYYFEKGDLAQSKGKWEEAVSYFEQAMDENLVPVEGVEYLPFIKAYTKLGQIEDAVSLTARTFNKSYFTKPLLCQFWQDTLKENPTIAISSVTSVYNSDTCPSFFAKGK